MCVSVLDPCRLSGWRVTVPLAETDESTSLPLGTFRSPSPKRVSAGQGPGLIPSPGPERGPLFHQRHHARGSFPIVASPRPRPSSGISSIAWVQNSDGRYCGSVACLARASQSPSKGVPVAHRSASQVSPSQRRGCGYLATAKPLLATHSWAIGYGSENAALCRS